MPGQLCSGSWHSPNNHLFGFTLTGSSYLYSMPQEVNMWPIKEKEEVDETKIPDAGGSVVDSLLMFGFWLTTWYFGQR